MSDSTNPKDPAFAGPCPRCGGGVPNDVSAGEYPGALSRYDNETFVCSNCGTLEAFSSGHLIPVDFALDSPEADRIRVEHRAAEASR